MKNKKRIQQAALKPHHFIIAGVIIVAALAGYAYFLFFGTVNASPGFAPVTIADAATNPDGPEVQKALKAGKVVRINLEGCPNLHKVSDTLYRGAQPTREGFENLKKLGIKTVINLRDHHSDKDLLPAEGLHYVAISTDTWDVNKQTVIDFLRTASDPNAAPVFVHCQHGADRTGTMVAAYRMIIQGWNTDRAIFEMTRGGYGFHPLWAELPAFLRKLNAEEIKKELKAD